jgi:lysozyme family protein
MATFEAAIPVILAHEGGYTVDDGGPTNYGWTKAALLDVTKHEWSTDEVKAMTAEQAADLYREFYWNGFDDIADQVIATKLLDMAINMEPPGAQVAIGQAVKIAQRAVNSLGASICEDGFWGHETCGAINACAPNILIAAIVQEQARFYRNLAAQNPRLYGPYLVDWLKRAAWCG